MQNIWTAAATTGGPAAPPAQVTFGAGRYDGRMGVEWTPDGRIFHHSLAGGGDDIGVTNADGTGQRRLTDGKGTYVHPGVSPDGRRLALSRGSSSSASSSSGTRGEADTPPAVWAEPFLSANAPG